MINLIHSIFIKNTNTISKLNPEYFLDDTPKSKKLLEVSCTMKGNYFRNEVTTVICPSGCDLTTANLWGTGAFTEDSYICAAAIMEGKITRKILVIKLYIIRNNKFLNAGSNVDKML